MAGRSYGLQKAGLPRNHEASKDPDAPIRQGNYLRAKLADKSPGAIPAEALMYDKAYEAFKADTVFWKAWKVVDCARTPPGTSISRDRAMIRVVMDLQPDQKLFPTAYTPGHRTIPIDADAETAAADSEPQEVAGLPPGYSIALDVYILATARMRLHHMRQYRGGSIDPSVEWLDSIIRKHEPQGPRAKAKVSKPQAPMLGGPPGGVPGGVPGSQEQFSKALEPFSVLYGNPTTKVYDIVADLARRATSPEGWVERKHVTDEGMADNKRLTREQVVEAIAYWEKLSTMATSEDKGRVRLLVPVRFGDTVYLRAWNEALLRVAGDGEALGSLKAVGTNQDGLHAFTVEGKTYDWTGDVSSGDTAFLRAQETGTFAYLDGDPPLQSTLQGDSKKVQHKDRMAKNAFVIEKSAGGRIMSGDVVYLRAHTGSYLDVQGEKVRAQLGGREQGFHLIKAHDLGPARGHSVRQQVRYEHALMDADGDLPDHSDLILPRDQAAARGNSGVGDWLDQELERIAPGPPVGRGAPGANINALLARQRPLAGSPPADRALTTSL